MPNSLAAEFRAELDRIGAALRGLPPELAEVPWREGGWTRAQIVGHLLDSAANNRQRFVRAATGGAYRGPNYGQDAWVAAHGYAEQAWDTLLDWWRVEHEILCAVVDRIAEDRMASLCSIDDEAPVTLGYLIEDYVRHQQWHLKQITAGAEA
ncbi:MAG TPA: DinB family protein [Terracidiphilus sp.]|nr:DinB family protein [Terracidiphilus sp.]